MRSLAVMTILGVALFAAGCIGEEPTGPSVMNTGNNNAFNFSDESNGPSTAQTPAPVVITPVVLAPAEPE